MNNTEKNTLLVVDDTPENIDVLRGILGADYTVKIATSGQLALKIIAAQPPDLILLDIMMPGMDGYEVCRQIKGNEATRHIPVIFVTALGEIKDEALGFELGAADYIVKPVSPPIVRARVQAHLDLADQRRYLQHLVAERTGELERSNRQLEQTHLVMLQQLGRAADYRDNETGKHVTRVGNFSRLLGLACGFMETRAEHLMYASMMHDIGKIGVPDHILLKPGKLTVEEFEIMKTHTTLGRNAIDEAERRLGMRVAFLSVSKEIAYSHQEKWDGSGYPQGLAGDAIPVSARLMAVADVYDALISKRVYKPAFSHDQACNTIIRGKGTHFDPDMVDAFVDIAEDFRSIAQKYPDPG